MSEALQGGHNNHKDDSNIKPSWPYTGFDQNREPG